MFKRGLFLIFLLIAFSAKAQQPAPVPSGPRLVRYHQYHHDSTHTINDVVCRYIPRAHVNQNNGLLRVYDFVPAETDLVFFELTRFAQLQVAFEIKKGATKVKNPTAYWVNNFYLMSARKSETKDFLTGELTFKRTNNSEIIVDGKLNIDTDYPSTHQEIVFDKSKLRILTLQEVVKMEDDEQAAVRREDEMMMGLAKLISTERKIFLDSISTTSNKLSEPRENDLGLLEITIGDQKLFLHYLTAEDSVLSGTEAKFLKQRLTKKITAYLSSKH